MRGLWAPLVLVLARVRHRPQLWLPSVAGLAIATAFAVTVLIEATVAGDQAARKVLAGASPLERSVRVTASGPSSPALDAQGRRLLSGLGLPAITRVTLLDPVRLSGIVVRPVAISPLSRWIATRGQITGLSRCRPADCPVLLVSGRIARRSLVALGVRLTVAGRVQLSSTTPLGFDPGAGGGPPVVLTGDPAGLDRLPALSGVYRTQGWLSIAPLARLQSWQLTGFERRLQSLQSGLPSGGPILSAPFSALDAGRRHAAGARSDLLAAGGGSIAALTVFLILAAYALRRERAADVRRLQAAGARTGQRLAFAVSEASLLCAVALTAGLGLGIGAGSWLCAHAGLPVGPVLAHALLNTGATTGLIGGWLLATVTVSAVLIATWRHGADGLAVAAAAALGLALVRGDEVAAVLLAPLVCVCAGVLVFRLAAVVLRTAERLAHRGAPVIRLALIGLARAPTAPALAIAFLAVSIGLGGFALGYRATLLRATADQAADRVPLAVRVAPAPNFSTPVQLATLARWRRLSGGPVLPIRRTEATFTSGSAAVTVPALGVPAGGLRLISGWRTSDGSAPLAALGRRLRPAGQIRRAGPLLGDGSAWLRISAASQIEVTADLRAESGAITQIDLGPADHRPRTARLHMPAGRYELAALELDQPTGLTITNGHQNGENPAAATQSSTSVTLGPLRIATAAGGTAVVALRSWRGVGAATGHPAGRDRLAVALHDSGAPGIIRPAQPSDTKPIPLLADPATAAASREGLMALTVDGLPISGRIVGTLRRFPTVSSSAAGFIVGDEATLAAALDASLPGQGQPDELWLDPHHLRSLSAALSAPPLSSLAVGYRSRVENALRSAPIARAVLGTLTAAAAISVVLALAGMLVALLGALRDRRAERDLEVLGLGPAGMARELRLRILIASGLGLAAGLAVAAGLIGLAVAAVRTAAGVSAVWPPPIAVEPWGQLAGAAAAVMAALALTGWIAAGTAIGRGGRR